MVMSFKMLKFSAQILGSWYAVMWHQSNSSISFSLSSHLWIEDVEKVWVSSFPWMWASRSTILCGLHDRDILCGINRTVPSRFGYCLIMTMTMHILHEISSSNTISMGGREVAPPRYWYHSVNWCIMASRLLSFCILKWIIVHYCAIDRYTCNILVLDPANNVYV